MAYKFKLKYVPLQFFLVVQLLIIGSPYEDYFIGPCYFVHDGQLLNVSDN